MANMSILAAGGAMGVPKWFSNVSLGNQPLSTVGTDTLTTALTLYLTEIFVPVNFSVTKLAHLNGSTPQARTYQLGLWDVGGHFLAGTGTFTIPTASPNTFVEQNVLSSLVITRGRYWFGFIANGNTDLRTIPGAILGGSPQVRTGTIASYLAAISDSLTAFRVTLAPTDFVADVGPVCYIG